MTLSPIISRRSRLKNYIKEETNKPLRKFPGYFGRLASFSLLRKKSSDSIRKQPITIRRIYTEDDMVNYKLQNDSEVKDDNEYGIDEILSPYNDDISEICTSDMSVEQREREIRYDESIECSTVKLGDFYDDPKDEFVKLRSKNSTKENDSPSASSSIFERANSLMFEDDTISHSTSKHSLILSKLSDIENYNVLDVMTNEQYFDTGSINDANIEVFKTSANELNLRLVVKPPMLLQSTHKSISPIKPASDMEVIPNDNRGSSNFNKINLAASNDKDVRVEHESLYLAKGNFEVDNYNICKNEMALLVQEHKLSISKHEKKINHLRDLLEQERNINKLLSTRQQRKYNLKIDSSAQITKMRRQFIPIDISVGSEPSVFNDNQPKNPRDMPIIMNQISPSPFSISINNETSTKTLNKNFVKDKTFPIAPTIYHSTPEGIFCAGLDKKAWKDAKENQRKDAYYALTHNTLDGQDEEERIDLTNLNKTFGSSKSSMKTQHSMASFYSHLTTPDFSNSFLAIYA